MNFKTGDKVRVRLGNRSAPGTVTLASANGNSLIVHGEKLPWSGGMTVDPARGKMVLCLLREGDEGNKFRSIHSGDQYQISPGAALTLGLDWEDE